MGQLSISNVINISVSQAPLGLGLYNTSNLALFTTDAFANSFGSAGFALYLGPSQVGSDFGTLSSTFAMANDVFSQQPNILANNGYLAVIPLLPAVEDIGFSQAPAGGSFQLIYGSQSAVIAYNASTSVIQSAIQGFSGLSQASVSGSIGSGSAALVVKMYGFYGTPAAFTVGTNTLVDGSGSAVTVTPSIVGSGETLAAAIARTNSLVQYFGVMENLTVADLGSTDLVAAASAIQALNKLLFAVSFNAADIGSPSGIFFSGIQQASLTQTRCLYYGGSEQTALGFMASYAGRALSTNFAGSNTTETMHLKQLSGVSPDPTMTQTLLNQAQTAGADCYVSLQGVPAVFTSGANEFFDQVYNLQAFVGALQVAGFNYLAQSSTKIPQTEQGMSGLKGAYRAVCEQYVQNAYIAPGSWTSPDTFGNQVDFLNNIASLGYYIFSAPVSQQAAAARAARQAPLVEIAVKEAGAIQSSDVLIFVNP